MPTVTGMTAAAMIAIRDQMVVSASIDGAKHLILTTYDGTEIDVGSIPGAVGAASDTASGIVELATSAETTTGTDATRAVTPAGLLSALNAKQPLDDDLTAIANATPSNDDFIQRKGGTWVNRTVAQVAADLIASSAIFASDTQKGLVELATNAETLTGTDTTRAVTPASMASALSGTYRYVQTVKFTSSGTFSKASYSGIKAVRIRAVGGGGGGGGSGAAVAAQHSSGSGGGGGGYAEKFVLESSLTSSVTVTIGAGGSGSSNAAGGTGGSTSFGSHAVAAGGAGGDTFPSTAVMIGALGGAGGAGTTGDILMPGSVGGLGSGNATLGLGGSGGSSQFGGGAVGAYTSTGSGTVAGTAASANSGGGGGGSTTNAGGGAMSGGAGGSGMVLVEVYA